MGVLFSCYNVIEAQGGADMQITLAIVFSAIGLLLILWVLYSREIPLFLRTILKAGIIGVIVSTFLWAFLVWEIPIGWLSFTVLGAMSGVIIGAIISLAKYRLAS